MHQLNNFSVLFSNLLRTVHQSQISEILSKPEAFVLPTLFHLPPPPGPSPTQTLVSPLLVPLAKETLHPEASRLALSVPQISGPFLTNISSNKNYKRLHGYLSVRGKTL